MLFSLVLAVTFAVLAAFFANDNQMAAHITLFGWPIQGKLGTIIVVAFAVGALFGVAAMLPAYLARTWALVRSRRKVQDLERGASPEQSTGLKQV